MISSWIRGGHPTAHSLGMPRRRFARLYQADANVQRAWAMKYDEAKDRALADTLDSPRLLERFRSGRSLPRGFGFSLDERMVEIPWAVANLTPGGRVLDAGSSFNHPVILERVVPLVESLTMVTFTEEETRPEFDVQHVVGDLRSLPLDDASFDAISCISTLDHVGMDNSEYGSTEPPSDDPDAEVGRALAELRRVLRPGGELLITVPYGRPEDFGWCRQFDELGLRRMIDSFGDAEATVGIYAHTRRGWNRSTPEHAADATYRDPRTHEPLASGCVYAAEAVACLHLTRPASPEA
jgi:SAM-dependent methyltransferase